MSQVFTPCTGAVEIRRPGCTNSDFLTVRLDGASFTAEFAVTNVVLEMSGNYQFLHTVNDFVYFYAFGDRVGTLNISGVSFLKTCPGAKSGTPLLAIYNKYQSSKAATRGGRSMRVTLATADDAKTFHGFLVGMRLEVGDNGMGPIGNWTMRFDVLPALTTTLGDLGGEEIIGAIGGLVGTVLDALGAAAAGPTNTVEGGEQTGFGGPQTGGGYQAPQPQTGGGFIVTPSDGGTTT